jgi:glycosyltransferase involved in cell wall biosynthesis
MKTASQPLVSVVTPVHNEAEYLVECIESILAQTYQNWDYTIVDNCSTDGSGEIARRYAVKDPRIRVQRNHEFLRAIPNHNVALLQISATSKYCKVVLGDDWIFPECLERMVAVAEEHPSVGIVGAYSLEGHAVAWTGLPYPGSVVSGRWICREHLLNQLYVFGSATSVLYRADLVRSHNPFYNEANIHADTEVCFELLKSCDFGFVHQVLTFSRVRPGSLTTVSSDLQTDMAGMLRTLVAHGRDYLTSEEFTDRLNGHLDDYYRFLGKSLMLGRSRKFWDYHKGQLAENRVDFSQARLVKGLLATMCSAALNPMDTVQKILKSRNGQSLPDRKQQPWKQADCSSPSGRSD